MKRDASIMIRTVHLLCLPALLLLGLFACTEFQPGAAVVKWEPGTSPLLAGAPQDGRYSLYDSSDLRPKITVALKKGQPLGFSEEAGILKAVAGDQKFPLPDRTSTHYWRIRE